MNRPFIEFQGSILNKEVFTTHFVCDLEKCKGACCTLESEYGAPLLEEELALIEAALPAALEYLPAEHRAEIMKNGFSENKEGELVTRSVNNRACVLVYYVNGVAKCALERAYFDGKTTFRKPISCHLFPIRIADFMGEVLRYEQFSECAPALERGKQEKVTIFEFCKEALERKYSKEWFIKLSKSIQE